MSFFSKMNPFNFSTLNPFQKKESTPAAIPVTKSDNKIDVKPTTNIVVDNKKDEKEIQQIDQERKSDEEISKLEFLSQEKDRELKKDFLSKLDSYLEHGKNTLITLFVAGSLIYVYSKKKGE